MLQATRTHNMRYLREKTNMRYLNMKYLTLDKKTKIRYPSQQTTQTSFLRNRTGFVEITTPPGKTNTSYLKPRKDRIYVAQNLNLRKLKQKKNMRYIKQKMNIRI